MGVVYLSGLLCLVSFFKLVSLGLILGWCYYVWVGACFVVNYPSSFPFFLSLFLCLDFISYIPIEGNCSYIFKNIVLGCLLGLRELQ